LQKKLKIGRTRLCFLINDMVKQGRAERFAGVEITDSGRRCNQIWYRLRG
jgi:hypothetical protein